MRKFALLLCTISVLHCFSQKRQTTIHFGFDRFNLDAGSGSILDSLVILGITNIELYGHCDGKGDVAYNERLSLQRVHSVKSYLLTKGIPETAFSKENGFGKRQPLNDNSTDELRAMNRRVSILFETNSIPEVKQAPSAPAARQEPQSLEKAMTDSSVKTGTNIVLKNLNFIGGRHVLLPESLPVLEELLGTMKRYPSLNIEITGHICCVFDGNDGLDNDLGTRDLSFQRAKTVYNYLVENGISTDRLAFKGMGSKQPLIYPERSESDMSNNRRVEIQIISK